MTPRACVCAAVWSGARVKFALAMLVLVGGELTAQGPAAAEPRRAHLGRVLGPDGAPVAGASVTFLSRDNGLGSGADVVRAVARDNGRFRAALLRGRDYRAYAVAPAGTLLEAAPVVSALSELGVPVTELRFAADDVAAPPETFVVRGLEPWRELGEVRLQLWIDGCPLAMEDEVVGPSGSVRLPPLPQAEMQAFVFVRGQLVHAEDYGSGFRMPAPFVVRGRVVDADGAAVAGASIHRVYSSWTQRGALPSRGLVRRFEVAKTDQDGRAEWLLAAYEDPFVEKQNNLPPRTFVASAAGFRGCVAGFTKEVLCDHEIITDRVEDRTLPFVLERAEPVQVSFGQGVSVTGISWSAHYHMHHDEASYATHHDVGVAGVVSEDGATITPWPKGAEEPRVFLLGVTPRLAPEHPFARVVAPWPMEVPLAAPAGARAATPPVVPVCVRVVDASGGPASELDVGLFSMERGLDEPFAIPAATDAGGRLVLPASPGRYLLVVLGRSEWLRHEFEVAPAMDPLELRLGPMPQMRLRVVDIAGLPLEGVGVGSSGAGSRSTRDPLQSVLQEVAQSFHGRYFSRIESDRDGRLVLPFIAAAGRSVSFRLRTWSREGPALTSARLSLTETDDFEEIVLKAK